MFFERNLCELVENFVPETTDVNGIVETLKLSEKYVKCLKITQLLPPIKLPQVPKSFFQTHFFKDIPSLRNSVKSSDNIYQRS